jgi:hypothetical protein
MGLNTCIQQFVKRMNDLNRFLLYFADENPEKLDQDEIIENLDQTKALLTLTATILLLFFINF